MNGILKTGLLILLAVLILKYALKLAGSIFGILVTIAILVILVGIYRQVKEG